MLRRLSVGSPLSFPQRLVLLALLAAALLPGLPALAQEGATHAACDALACVDKGDDCLTTWVSIPPGQPEQPIRSAEDVVDAIPYVVRVTKEFPIGDDVCKSYTWNAETGECTGEPFEEGGDCEVPEPGSANCGSACFCLEPGQGVEVERSRGGPWQLFGTDGPVEWNLQPNRYYIVSVPIGVEGRTANNLLQAFNRADNGSCRIVYVSKLNCNGTLTNFSGSGGGYNFSLEPGEAYRVVTSDRDCNPHGQMAPAPTHVPRGCRGAQYAVNGTGNGAGYGWGVDAFYERPYLGLEDPEASDPFAPGAGPGADAAAEARALVEDILAQEEKEDVYAQVNRNFADGNRLCVLGAPMNPVLWISEFGMPPEEGCNVNDSGPCNLEGASIELDAFPAPFVWLDKELVHWTDVADTYDVVWGHVQALRETGGDFSVATGGCLVADTRELEESHEWLEPEPEIDAIWFLVRAANAWLIGFYDQGAEAGLVAPRDPGIAGSGSDCP